MLECDYAEVSVAESREEIFSVIFGLLKKTISLLKPQEQTHLESKTFNDNHENEIQHLESSLSLKDGQQNENETSLHLSNNIDANIGIKRDKNQNILPKRNKSLSFNEGGRFASANDDCKICQNNRYKTINLNYFKAEGSTRQPKLPCKKRKSESSYGFKNPPLLPRTYSLQENERRPNSKFKKSQKQKDAQAHWRQGKTEREVQMFQKKNTISHNCFTSCNDLHSEESGCNDFYTSKATKDFYKDTHEPKCSFIKGQSLSPRNSCSRRNCNDNKKEESFFLKPPTGSKKTPSKLPLNEFECKSYPPKKYSLEALTSKGSRTSLQELFQNLSKEKEHNLCENLLPPKSLTAFNFSSFQDLNKVNKKCFYDYSSVDASSRASEKRERKLCLFGRTVLGHVFSKTSLPDLPKATANLCTKFDSLKRTLKKRSL